MDRERTKSWLRALLASAGGKGAIGGLALGWFVSSFLPAGDPSGPRNTVTVTRDSVNGPQTNVYNVPPTAILFSMVGFLLGMMYAGRPWRKRAEEEQPVELDADAELARNDRMIDVPPPAREPMLELTVDNAENYVRAQSLVGNEAVQVEALGGGVSNQVLRMTTASRSFVLKQSRPQLRTKDAWFSDLDRVIREQEVMTALGMWLPEGVVPEVLFVDRANYLFTMGHAPADAIVWKQSLLEGRVDLEMGEKAGRVLGRMHQASADAPGQFARFADPTVFVQLRVDPFYRCIQERLPDVAGPVGDLVEQMLTRKEALCHGDYTPKNMLVHEHGFMLVDYETAYYGDPAMDLGLFLAHLMLKSIRRPDQRETYSLLTRGFWRGYHEQRLELADLEARGIAHLGACLLARIDGTSPVDYLTEDGRQAVRQLGRSLLFDRPTRWSEVLGLVEKA